VPGFFKIEAKRLSAFLGVEQLSSSSKRHVMTEQSPSHYGSFSVP